MQVHFISYQWVMSYNTKVTFLYFSNFLLSLIIVKDSFKTHTHTHFKNVSFFFFYASILTGEEKKKKGEVFFFFCVLALEIFQEFSKYNSRNFNENEDSK